MQQQSNHAISARLRAAGRPAKVCAANEREQNSSGLLRRLRLLAMTGMTILFIASLPTQAHAFCGFYVAKADTKLFNKASKVVLVRDGDRTVITMASDYEGDLKEFAMVVPVPTFIEKEQIHVTENAIIDHLDAYTAPRLVEYFDDNPCQRPVMYEMMASSPRMMKGMADTTASAQALGVTIEAEYTVGEYDILILSAKESDGLATWLTGNGYKIPEGASEVLESYIKQGTRFFVAKVNLEEQTKTGATYLRPLSIAFESPKFMLPIRLGTVNAKDSQEMFVFALTKNGRVETTNYRTIKIPSDSDIPLFVKEEFGDFYKAMFDTSVKKEGMRAVFLEYAWDMNWCDPCAADPLSDKELKELGVFWIGEGYNDKTMQPGIMLRRPMPQPQARNVFVTRLHLRYDAAHFPEDLMFQETSDRQNFQGRYVLRHPWKGDEQCEAATTYRQSLPQRFDQEAKTLAGMTGWDINNIRSKMKQSGQDSGDDKSGSGNDDKKWWQRLWN